MKKLAILGVVVFVALLALLLTRPATVMPPPRPDPTPNLAGRRGAITDSTFTVGFTDFDSYERFYATAPKTDAQGLQAMLDRLRADGVLVPLQPGEPVTIMGQRARSLEAYDVQLVSGRRVWVSPVVVKLQ